MYKNPRILQILQNVDYGASEELTPPKHSDINPGSYIIQEDCSLLPERAEIEHEIIFPNIEYDASQEFTIPEFSDVPPGHYVLQKGCLLLLEKNETDTVSINGTPTNIIICNDGSLRKRSISSSKGTVSILMDSVLRSPTSDCITDLVLEQQIMIDAQDKIEEPPTNDPILSPSEEHLYTIQQTITDSLSILKSNSDDISVHGNETDKQDKTSADIVVLCPIEDYRNIVEDAKTSSSTGSRSCQNATTEQNTKTSQSQPRKRQKHSRPQDWSANKNKEQREKGKPYLGKKKIDDKWSFIEPKDERNIKDRCNCKLSLKGDTKLQCDKIPEEERQKCFKKVWNMIWKEKKVYIKMSSICKRKQRERCAGTSSRRANSVELYLSDSKGTRYRVCKKMFLNSLCVGEWVIKKWIIRDDIHKNVQKNHVKDELHKQLRRFFDSLPKLESHYCRKDSSKLYLEPLWTSKLQLYKAYKDNFCPREKAEPLSIATFSNVFEELNWSLFRPKKDLCDICESFKTGNITESDYKMHQDMKDEARKELAKDTASNDEVVTMDLQSVLLSPRSNVSALYY